MSEFDPKAAAEELADLIVQLSDGADFAKGISAPLMNVLLVGKTEERNPLKYAEIFRLAASKADSSSWMHFACRSEEINGKRRAKGADMPALALELDRLVAEANDQLPNTKERNTLLGSVLWNIALVRRGLRQYSEAAAAQRQSSAWYGLAGNVEKQLIGLFAAQSEDVTAAFVDGDDDLIVKSCKALVAARDHAEYALPAYPDWMKDNAPLSIAWVLMMARQIEVPAYITGESAAIWHSVDFDRGLKSRFPQWAKVFNVFAMYYDGRHEEVAAQVPVDLPSSSADNAALTVQVVVALAERKLGRVDEAKARLTAVANHQGPDGGIPMAVAKRLLA